MAIAVSLLFDRAISDAVVAHWQRLADAGLSRSMLELDYTPHVTLVVYDQLDIDHACAAIDGVFRQVRRMAVSLSAVATFASSGVLYAALDPSPGLSKLHADLVAAVGAACRPHYQVARWTPHCTLAMDMDAVALQRAGRLTQQHWQALSGTFETASLVEFRPVVPIQRWDLR